MATFAFYRFKLNEPSCIKETFSAFEPEKRLDLIVSQQKKDGSYDDNKVITKCYNNDILTNHEDIIVLTIEILSANQLQPKARISPLKQANCSTIASIL